MIFGIVLPANSQTDIRIRFDTVKGFGVFSPGQFIVWPEEIKIIVKDIPSNINEYCVRKIDFQNYNTIYQLEKKDELSKETFDEIVSKYSLNRQLITDVNYNHSINVLIGKISQKELIVILDKNNNQSYNDDEKFTFPIYTNIEEEKAAMKKLPITDIAFEYFNGSEIKKITLPIQINPYKGSLGIIMNADSIEQNFFLAISFPFYRFNKISINEKSYCAYLTNGFTSIDYTKKNSNLIITQEGDAKTTEFNGSIPYSIGDIITIDSLQYELTKVSTFGDSIDLKFIGYNKFLGGFQEGEFLPKLNAITINRQSFEFNDYKGKYLLLDFWGTWCNPCIKLIPQIKDLNEKFKGQNFALISIAYDDNIDKVKQFIDNKQMNWIHLLQNAIENDIITKLKIFQYPTIILIDPTGKIISRGKEIGEIDRFLTETLIQ